MEVAQPQGLGAEAGDVTDDCHRARVNASNMKGGIGVAVHHPRAPWLDEEHLFDDANVPGCMLEQDQERRLLAATIFLREDTRGCFNE